MLVVSDTSPLNYLVLIGNDSLLPSLFGQVLTAPAVISEMTRPGSPEPVRVWASAPPPWLNVRAPATIEPALRLGRGEVEAISLAREVAADVVLIDERKGAQAAKSLGLFVTGTLGVLLLAHERGLVPLRASIEALRRTSFRATDELYNHLLRISGEA